MYGLLNNLGVLLFYVCVLGVGLFTLAYPLYLYIRANLLQHKIYVPPTQQMAPHAWPSVSMVVAVRNGQALVEDKINNCLSLNYPADKLNFIFIADGCTDQTPALLQQYANPRIQVLNSPQHIGKARALNFACHKAQADILVFSDMDALLDTQSIRSLVTHFQSPQVGGVCGLRQIQREKATLGEGQASYISFDSWIKQQESQLGYLTSNDGKLYAIRRPLFKPLLEGVTDDLCNGLSIAAQGFQWVFEPAATAYIKPPARSLGHEIQRRRRITCRSLNGLKHFSATLWALPAQRLLVVALWVNKGLRRLLPFFLLGILLSCSWLNQVVIFNWLLHLQLWAYAGALSYFVLQFFPLPKPLAKVLASACYFLIGLLGMALGVFDFMRGRTVIKWEPIKHD